MPTRVGGRISTFAGRNGRRLRIVRQEEVDAVDFRERSRRPCRSAAGRCLDAYGRLPGHETRQSPMRAENRRAGRSHGTEVASISAGGSAVRPPDLREARSPSRRGKPEHHRDPAGNIAAALHRSVRLRPISFRSRYESHFLSTWRPPSLQFRRNVASAGGIVELNAEGRVAQWQGRSAQTIAFFGSASLARHRRAAVVGPMQ